MIEADDGFHLERRVHAGLATVWECVLDARGWLNEEIELEARPGGHMREPWTDSNGCRHLTEADVIAFHPPYGLVLCWRDADWPFDTVVAIYLDEDNGDCRISIDHDGWSNAPAQLRDNLLAQHRNGWRRHLEALAALAEARAASRH
jgi:uncharacterized protein YndB with AHSA1/START domain